LCPLYRGKVKDTQPVKVETPEKEEKPEELPKIERRNNLPLYIATAIMGAIVLLAGGILIGRRIFPPTQPVIITQLVEVVNIV
jgi:hypothetical protein